MGEGKESLKAALDRISKVHEVTVAQIKNMDRPEIEVIPSGSYTIDHALGVGGYPRGRIIEIYGKESGGKTTLSLLAIAEAQKQGGVAAFVDLEHSLSMDWAGKLGVKVDDLIFLQPNSGEQALAIVEDLVKTDQVDIIVIDSVAALVPKAELEGEIGDGFMASQARMLSQALRRLVGVIGKSKTVVLFINQVRENLNPYQEKEVTPGGKALKFYSSLRMSVKKVSSSEITDASKAIVGHRVEISVRKNKVAPPSTKAEFALNFLTGVDRIDELVTLGLTLGIVEQAGPTYRFGTLTTKGMEKFMEAIRADVKLQSDLWKAIQDKRKK